MKSKVDSKCGPGVAALFEKIWEFSDKYLHPEYSVCSPGQALADVSLISPKLDTRNESYLISLVSFWFFFFDKLLANKKQLI